MTVAKHANRQGSAANVISGTVIQTLGQLAGSAMGLLILRTITSSLGTNGYGIYSTAIAYVTTFSILTDLGVNAVTPREIAADPARTQAIVTGNMGARLILCCAVIPALFGLSWLIYPSAGAAFHWDLVIAAAMLLGDALRSICYAVLIATYRNGTIGLVSFAQQGLLFLAVLVASELFATVPVYLLCFVGSYMISALVALILVPKHALGLPQFRWSTFKSIMRNSGSIGLLQIVNMAYLRFGFISISVVATFSDVGVYAVAYALISPFVFIPTYAMSALIPTLAKSDRERQSVVIQHAFGYMCALACILACGGVLVSHDLIGLVASASFSEAARPFELLLVGTAFSYLTTVFSYSAISLGKHSKLVIGSIVTLVLNVALNFALIPTFGVNGAAGSTAICDAILFLLVFRIFSVASGIRIKVLSPTLRCAASSVVSLAAAEGGSHLLAETSPSLRIVIDCLMLSAAYLVVGSLLSAFPVGFEIRELVAKMKRRSVVGRG